MVSEATSDTENYVIVLYSCSVSSLLSRDGDATKRNKTTGEASYSEGEENSLESTRRKQAFPFRISVEIGNEVNGGDRFLQQALSFEKSGWGYTQCIYAGEKN